MDVFCIHCDHRISLGSRVEAGRRVACPACQAHLEVINLNPVELDWAYDEPYDEPRRTRPMDEGRGVCREGSEGP